MNETPEKRKVGRPMGKLHQEDVRRKIQAGQLLKVLENHALNDDGKELSATRIKAIEILLRKSLPDLSSVELSGPDGGAVQANLVLNVIGVPGNPAP